MILLGMVLGLGLALLAVPFDLRVQLRYQARLRTEVELRWFFGLVPLRTTGPEASEQPRSVRPRGRFSAGSMLRTEGFARRCLRFAGQLLRSAHIRELELVGRVGFDDPADTGQLWALLGPLNGLASTLHPARVSIEPDFAGEVLEVEGVGDLRVVPGRVIVVVLAFALSPVTLRALRAGAR